MAGTLDFYNYDIEANGVISQKQQQAQIDSAQNEKIKELKQGGGYPPEGGIPATDLASGVQSSLGKADTAYQKPNSGIPVSDLDSNVQASLSKADNSAADNHEHGNILNNGTVTAMDTGTGANSVDISSGDRLLIVDSSASGKLAPTRIQFDGTTTDQFLSKKGTFEEISVADKESISNKVTALSSSSTDTQYPSAKCVYDAIQASSVTQVQADWDETDTSVPAYIQNKPTIPDAQIQADWNQTTTTAKDYINNKPDLSIYAQSSNLATVATSGSYNDLTNKPSIPAAQIQSDWNQTTTTAKDYIKNKPTIPDDSNLVHKTGNETITGDKTFISEEINIIDPTDSSFANKFILKGNKLIYSYSPPRPNLSNQANFDFIKTIDGTDSQERVYYKTLQQALDEKEATSNKVTSISSSSTDTQYPSAKCVYDEVGDASSVLAAVLGSSTLSFEQTSNKVTSLSSQSTDTQYPSAKCVYDLVGDIENLLAAI